MLDTAVSGIVHVRAPQTSARCTVSTKLSMDASYDLFSLTQRCILLSCAS